MEYGCSGDATSESFKSWAQQMEESYQLQLALALRLSSGDALATDPCALDFRSHDAQGRLLPFFDSPEAVSHRFWVNGCLSYFDRIPDGFYVVNGVDPYMWSISSDQKAIRIPSFELLRTVDPCAEMSIEVVLIDRFRDSGLKELHNKVINQSSCWNTSKDMVDHLAKIVINHMGGIASAEGETFVRCWKERTKVLKDHLNSIVLPIGSLPVGLCVHRALLFKVLADLINLPCRIVKGCKYCRRDVASACLVQIDNEREYLVDLFVKPGALSQPDSSLKCPSSILVSSPLSHPRFRPTPTEENFTILAKLYFFDCKSLDCVFEDTNAVYAADQHQEISSDLAEDKNVVTSSKNSKDSVSPLVNGADMNIIHGMDIKSSIPQLDIINSKHLVNIQIIPNPILATRHGHASPVSIFANPKPDRTYTMWSVEANKSVISNSSSELHIQDKDLAIQWSELTLKEKIGAGSFGTVHRAYWHGSEVAVKILEEQDFHAEHFKEFLSEVAIMKRLRHPNIILFMGAVTQPPHLSIVTEYLSGGSLHKLLRSPNAYLMLDERLRLNMAYDVAKGMNHLHQLRPPIVHRDLKSPNLLLDSTYTVKICDFGLSRSKANTYLSSKTAAGTPEWMAPEVLRNELSNEKSDVYSFGVILWELTTLEQPWRNLSQAQVITAVAIQGQRLKIPSSVNPSVAALIQVCLAADPSERPSFSYITETLEKLIKCLYPQPLNKQFSLHNYRSRMQREYVVD